LSNDASPHRLKRSFAYYIGFTFYGKLSGPILGFKIRVIFDSLPEAKHKVNDEQELVSGSSTCTTLPTLKELTETLSRVR
jgi:hypothetical protein